MDSEGLRALFQPFGPVATRRMFGGAGVYADDVCFAISLGGEVYLKTDAETRDAFAAAGSMPFVYEARGKTTATSYWRLVAEAYDEPDVLKHWAGLGLAAARRVAAAKMKKPKRATKAR